MAAEATTRVLRLRYRSKCAVCLRELEPGTKAEWNTKRKQAICVPCTKARPRSAGTSSVAGGSARAMGERRRTKQEARLRAEREARPVLGRLRQGLFPESDAGSSWEKGATGEERLAASLNPLVEAGTIEALHDRRIPRSSANIDHLLVAANGIWAVDAKRYQNQRIDKDTRGGLLSSRAVLSVGRRDRTSLVEGVHKQVEVVRGALIDAGFEGVPVHGALCFIDGEWGVLRRRPFTIDGVVVTWPKALRNRVSEAGDLEHDKRVRLVDELARALPPAR